MLVQHVLVCKVNLEGQHAVHMKASSTLLGIDFRLSLSPLRVLGTPQEVDEAWQGLKAWIEDESKDSNLAALFLSPSGLAVAFQDQVLHLNNRVPQSVLAPVKAAWEVVQAEVSTQGDWGIEKVKGGLRIARGAAVDRVLGKRIHQHIAFGEPKLISHFVVRPLPFRPPLWPAYRSSAIICGSRGASTSSSGSSSADRTSQVKTWAEPRV